MHGWGRIAVVVAAVTLCSGGALASANTPPLADAGLDQTVPNGTTVYLDAGGSVDPDGSITNATWSITGPNGTAVNSTCDNCTRTQFTPTRTGEYTATVSITDDDGATRNDTLSVTVEAIDGPSVTLTGPDRVRPDQPAPFTVTTTAGNADLRQLDWSRNGTKQQSVDLSGRNTTVTLNRSFSETKTYQLTAIVRDANGYSQSSSMRLRVDSSGGPNSDWCPGGQITNDGGDTWWCRESAMTTTNGRIMDLGAGAQPDTITWRNVDGVVYEMERSRWENLEGDDGMVTIQEMESEGQVATNNSKTSTGNKISYPGAGEIGTSAGSTIGGDSSMCFAPCGASTDGNIDIRNPSNGDSSSGKSSSDSSSSSSDSSSGGSSGKCFAPCGAPTSSNPVILGLSFPWIKGVGR